MDFHESVSATAAISAILGTYPFSIGLLREILQNSDDAGASKQVFLLDKRTHKADTILDGRLREHQGPALLAYNDATFRDDDWVALQRIHRSSKRSDTTKIGKYGIGFRSCYHITDSPQILSGDSLAILDPHHGGMKVKVAETFDKISDHLTAFNLDLLHPGYSPGRHLEASVIRLPLRKDGSLSEISQRVITCDEIGQLLADFVSQEIQISLLFLSHISTIEVQEVSEEGVRCIGKVEIDRRSPTTMIRGDGAHSEMGTLSVRFSSGAPPVVDHVQQWKSLRVAPAMDRVATLLSERLGYDAEPYMEKEKLSATVALALPVSPQQGQELSGRLFTFLPLPLPTGFPLHVHALFALTQARQNLWNGSEQGMLKRTRDHFLVEWNKALFDTFIPEAWAELLSISSHDDLGLPRDIFSIWPPQSQNTRGGDPAYWQPLAKSLLRIVVDKRLNIWPLVTSAHAPSFDSVQNLLIAAPEDSEYLSALASVGVKICLPPNHILDMMSDLHEIKRLTPHTARSALLANATFEDHGSRDVRSKLLLYLLSSGDPSALADIPVVPVANNGFIALLPEKAFGKHHVLFKGDEADVFSLCDESAIDLRLLPNVIQSLFYEKAPAVLNVVRFGASHIGEYVLRASLRGGFAEWLRGFWSWLGTRADQRTLFQPPRQTSLIMSRRGSLLSFSDVIFHFKEVDNATMVVLEELGLNFLDPNLPHSAIHFLEQCDVMKSARDICSLLEAIKRPVKTLGQRPESIKLLHGHFEVALLRSSHRMTANHREILCSLPIFSTFLVGPKSVGVKSTIGALPHGPSCYFFSEEHFKVLRLDGNCILLPTLANVAFASRFCLGVECTRVLSVLGRSTTFASSESDLLSLVIANFASQTKPFRRAFLQSLAAHLRSVPHHILQDVQAVPFVPVGKGNLLKPPKLVVDPQCNLASLFDSNENTLPRIVDGDDASILASLRSLRLLRTELSNDIVQERVANAQTSGSPSLSIRLLTLLETTRYDCSNLSAGFERRWLPTSDGLRSPRDCRDHRNRHHKALFDRVWGVLDAGALRITSPSLRRALGWESAIPLDVLKEQFRRELDGPPAFERLGILLQEFGARIRDIKGTRLEQELRQITDARAWVPVRSDLVMTTSHAVFDIPPPGFHLIPAKLVAEEGTVEFLTLMGCTKKPTNAALIEEIAQQPSPSPSINDVKRVVQLLKGLDTATMTTEDWDHGIIPDCDSVLRRRSAIYSNDLGARIYDAELPSDRWRVHNEIHSNLSTRLGIQTLRSLNLKLYDVDDEEMEEDLTTRIGNVLRQYSINQAFNEFLANASDAGATEFNIVIDERKHDATNVLSPKMADFQASPAVIVHNDGVFSPSDFKGIRHVGLGGKHDRTDTIGRFGLGALSMFHFTEMAMIVSGEYVQFLDPSRRFLPHEGDRGKSARRITLKQMRRLARDHLEPLRGIHGFSPDMDVYQGTIFRLPLRSSDQALRSSMSKEYITISKAERLVSSYEAIAVQSLLFIKIRSISASHRGIGEQDPRISWSTTIERQTHPHKDPQYEYTHMSAKVTSTRRSLVAEPRVDQWHVVHETAGLPKEYEPLMQKYKLRSLSAGVAVRISRDRPDQSKVYSRLPLPVTTSLPVHLDGSFILADDRRSIRLEGGGQANRESQYNYWLLSHKLAPLYHFLLERLAATTTAPFETTHWWPGSVEPQDNLTRAVVEAFYSQLAETPHQLCVSVTGLQFTPREGVFLGDVNQGVAKVARVLAPPGLISLTSSIKARVRGSGVRHVDPEFLVEVIKSNSERFESAYGSDEFGVGDLNDLVEFLLPDGANAKLLLDLPLLPLADGSLGSLEAPDGTLYYHHEPSLRISLASWTPWPLFPESRFVHPRLRAEPLLGGQFNVVRFEGAKIVTLIRVHNIIAPATTKRLKRQEQDWLNQFWEQYDHLNLDYALISSYPLVPTTRPDVYTSLSHCESRSVLPHLGISEQHPQWFYIVLESLGVTTVKIGDCSPALQRGLPNLSLQFDSVLHSLVTLGPRNLPRLFKRNTPDHQRRFANYAQDQLNRLFAQQAITGGNQSEEYREVIRHLPIWRGVQRAGEKLIHAADGQFKMFPLLLPISAATPFLAPTSYYFVDHISDPFKVLQVQPESLPTVVGNFLRMPDVLLARHLSHFKSLLTALLTLPPKDIVQVPNTTSRIVDCGTLYASSTDLFRVTFRNRPELFLHQALQDLEQPLEKFGLSVEVNFSTFRNCAQEVDQSADEEGAVAVFEWYNHHLWRYIGSQAARWQELGALRFIPRDETRCSYPDPPFSPGDYIPPLPPLVAPAEILLDDYKAIAWTQRAIPGGTLSSQTLIANPTLGVPSAAEVVEHLRCLVLIARDHPFDRNVLSDLIETYNWLMSHQSECEEALCSLQEEPLFLNVDKPSNSKSPWEFVAASDLLFDGPDEGKYRRARKFLLTYRSLLLRVGAIEITRPVQPVLQRSPAEEVLEHIRKSQNDQRQAMQFTDVFLVSSDDEKFPVHRSVLAISTKYFRSMFSGNWNDDTQGTVPLDCPSDILGLVLDYIYLGNVPETLTQGKLIAVLEIANRWDLTDLFASVENRLILTITPATYDNLHDVAQRLEAEVLAGVCRKYREDNAHKFEE